MSLFVQVILQIVLPAFLLIDLFRREYRQRRDWAIDVSMVALILLFVFQIARWDWFSYYFRILLFPALGLVSYVAYRCIDKEKPEEPREMAVKDYLSYGVKGVIVLVALVLNVQLLQGSMSPQGAVEMAYPLRGGVYYVGGGGASRWINNHNAFPPQDYALDIVRLNKYGNRARGIEPEILRKYTIFGDQVHSPCSGRIVTAEDGHEDNVPPAKDTLALAGNHVVIACKGVEVLLAHLREGSISVEEGQEVTEGAVLAEIGNSGNSTQPHLHIHAERGGEEGKILDGTGVPLKFNGRFLVRNSLFSGRINSED